MQINVSIDGLEGVDLGTVVGDEISYQDEETGATEYRPRTLGDLVAEKLAEKLYSESGGDWRYEVSKEAQKLRAELIREKIAPIVEKALEGPIRLTNTYGEPTGKEVTLTALIVDEARKIAGGGRSDGGRGPTLLQRVVTEQVGAAFAKELAEMVATEKAVVTKAVRDKAAEMISQAVEAGLAASGRKAASFR